jgi:hypothetical protein
MARLGLVFGHNYVSVDTHAEATAHFFEAVEKQVTAAGGVESRLAVVTTHGDKMGLRRVVEAAQTFGHGQNLYASQMNVSDG